MNAETAVYLVDPEPVLGDALSQLLQNYDIGVRAFPDGESFLKAINPADTSECCLLVTQELPGVDGISLLRRLGAESKHFPVIILTDQNPDQIRSTAEEAGATDVVDKPLLSAYLFARLAELLPGASHLPASAYSTMELSSGQKVVVRMMHPDDADIEQDFVTGLSDRSRYLRFFSGLKSLSPRLLKELTNPSFPLSYAMIATIEEEGEERIVGVARYAPTDSSEVAEFAVVVADEWQGHGIASQLMRGITVVASVAGFNYLEGVVLSENLPMLALARNLGFRESALEEGDPAVTRVRKNLRNPVQQD